MSSPVLRRRRVLRWFLLASAAVGSVLVLHAVHSVAVQPAAESLLERFARMSREAEARGLSQPFVGVTADGSVEPGLFAIRATGVSTAPVQQAAAAFLGALTPTQRARASFGADDVEWRKWMNQHFYRRQGVGFDEMTPAQRDSAVALLRASLSARGLTLSRDIMRLNHTLGELNGSDFEQYGEWLYYITVMGTPSASEPWGWQIDGHHLVINYFVLGDQVVMTPSFFGSEPVIATSGKYAGTRILQEEQAGGLAFVNALDEAQRSRAVLQSSKTGNHNLGEAWQDNVVVPYAGVPGSALREGQKEALLSLIALHLKMDDGHAKVKMHDVRAHLDATHFAWVGGTGPDSVFYYRIHSPVVLIEFDHQTPVGMRHLRPDRSPFRDHVHVVVRTPNGNDYGKDLLRQHYEAHAHDAAYGREAAQGRAMLRAW